MSNEEQLRIFKQGVKTWNDETTPSFKRRAAVALKAAGETAIDEFFQNPDVKVGQAAIVGWMEAGER